MLLPATLEVFLERFHPPEIPVLGVVFTVFLQGVVGQMHEVILNRGAVKSVEFGRETQIALIVEVEPSERVDKYPHPDVELTSVYQQRILYVLLQDYRAVVGEILLQAFEQVLTLALTVLAPVNCLLLRPKAVLISYPPLYIP